MLWLVLIKKKKKKSMLWLALLEMLKMTQLGLLRWFTVLISILLEGLYEMNWLACLVGGTCLGALVVISMSPAFPVKDQGSLIFLLQ
jgi:hypothetical protein